MILNVQHIALISLCCEVISSFVIFAVLTCELADVVLKRRCKLLSFSDNICCFFLYDLAYTYQITSKRDHSRQSYDVILILQEGGHRAGNLPPTRWSIFITSMPPASVLVTTRKLGHIITWHLPDPLWPDFAFFSLAPLVINLHAKSEFSSTNRSRDMEGVTKFQK